MNKYTLVTFMAVGLSLSGWLILSSNKPLDKKEENLESAKIEKKSYPNRKPLKLSEILLDTKNPEASSHAVESSELTIPTEDNLRPQDVNELLQFLISGRPGNMGDMEWAERVNVILNTLRAHGKANKGRVEGLIDCLFEIADGRHGKMLQLYAMQHLAQWSFEEVEQEEIARISTYFWSIADQTGHQSAGTAILMLSDMFANGLQLEEKRISDTAVSIASNSNLAQDVRISAIHACVDRQAFEVLPVARELAQDGDKILTLRKAAIHAIGELGQKEDMDLLSRLMHPNSKLEAATIPATKRLSERWAENQ